MSFMLLRGRGTNTPLAHGSTDHPAPCTGGEIHQAATTLLVAVPGPRNAFAYAFNPLFSSTSSSNITDLLSM